jgi:hypothetical protein
MIGQGLGRVAQAEKLSIQQLEEALENRTIPAYIGIPLLEEKVQLEQRIEDGPGRSDASSSNDDRRSGDGSGRRALWWD